MWIFVVYAGSWTLATPATWMLLYKLSLVCPPLFQPWCASLTAFQSRKLQMPMYSNTLAHAICQCATDAEKVLGLLVTTGVALGAARCFLSYWIDRQWHSSIWKHLNYLANNCVCLTSQDLELRSPSRNESVYSALLHVLQDLNGADRHVPVNPVALKRSFAKHQARFWGSVQQVHS